LKKVGDSPPVRKAIPVLTFALIVTTVICFTDFHSYPHVLNYWRSTASRNKARGTTICVRESPPDICGIHPGQKPVIERLRRVAAKTASLSVGGKTVAVFDPNDTLICLLAGISPWGRHDPMYPFTKLRVIEMCDELSATPPDFIVIHSAPENYHEYKGDDTWRRYHDITSANYDKIDSDGTFEVWRRKN
jgi:hypothetical protein